MRGRPSMESAPALITRGSGHRSTPISQAQVSGAWRHSDKGAAVGRLAAQYGSGWVRVGTQHFIKGRLHSWLLSDLALHLWQCTPCVRGLVIAECAAGPQGWQLDVKGLRGCLAPV